MRLEFVLVLSECRLMVQLKWAVSSKVVYHCYYLGWFKACWQLKWNWLRLEAGNSRARREGTKSYKLWNFDTGSLWFFCWLFTPFPIGHKKMHFYFSNIDYIPFWSSINDNKSAYQLTLHSGNKYSTVYLFSMFRIFPPSCSLKPPDTTLEL